MVRFIIDKFRQAPGPLKQPRLILADLADEVVDLMGTYLNQRKGGSSCAPCEQTFPRVESPAPATSRGDGGPSGDSADDVVDDRQGLLDIDPKLAAAIAVPGNKRKQEFKVLAILWDTQQREMPPMSAKSVSQHGENLGLSIRHENVRKVIRMRLEKHIKVHAEGVGSGTIYRYELAPVGKEYFTSTYFG